jgi:hypothetical protein
MWGGCLGARLICWSLLTSLVLGRLFKRGHGGLSSLRLLVFVVRWLLLNQSWRIFYSLFTWRLSIFLQGDRSLRYLNGIPVDRLRVKENRVRTDLAQLSLGCNVVLWNVVNHAIAVKLVQDYLIHGCTTRICVGHRIILLNLCGHSLTRQNDRNIIDMERRGMSHRPYVDKVVQIMIELNESFVDLPTFLLE